MFINKAESNTTNNNLAIYKLGASANTSNSTSNSAKKGTTAFEINFNKENSPYSSSSSTSNKQHSNSSLAKAQYLGNTPNQNQSELRSEFPILNASSNNNNNLNRHTSLKKLSPFTSNKNYNNSLDSSGFTSNSNNRMFSPPSKQLDTINYRHSNTPTTTNMFGTNSLGSRNEMPASQVCVVNAF